MPSPCDHTCCGRCSGPEFFAIGYACSFFIDRHRVGHRRAECPGFFQSLSVILDRGRHFYGGPRPPSFLLCRGMPTRIVELKTANRSHAAPPWCAARNRKSVDGNIATNPVRCSNYGEVPHSRTCIALQDASARNCANNAFQYLNGATQDALFETVRGFKSPRLQWS